MTREPEIRLLRPAEVAAMFKVGAKTVRNWAETGRLHSIRTPGGRDRRYSEAEVLALLAGQEWPPRTD